MRALLILSAALLTACAGNAAPTSGATASAAAQLDPATVAASAPAGWEASVTQGLKLEGGTSGRIPTTATVTMRRVVR